MARLLDRFSCQYPDLLTDKKKILWLSQNLHKEASTAKQLFQKSVPCRGGLRGNPWGLCVHGFWYANSSVGARFQYSLIKRQSQHSNSQYARWLLWDGKPGDFKNNLTLKIPAVESSNYWDWLSWKPRSIQTKLSPTQKVLTLRPGPALCGPWQQQRTSTQALSVSHV